ncbi:MAG: ArsR family transcriptional regulator, partial [Methanobacteriota archaeon]
MSDPLEHPTTLRIFLLIRSKGEVGVREVARKLDVKSPSTISWHLHQRRHSQGNGQTEYLPCCHTVRRYVHQSCT